MANPTLTRRTFLKGSAFAGAAAFLGSILTPGGLHIAAYADEKGNTSFVIYIMSREEVPIYAVDVSDISDPDRTMPIQGMRVHITSYAQEGASVDVVTDEAGMAFANIRALSCEKDDEDAVKFTFCGAVTATKEGYRETYLPTVWFESAVPKDGDGNHTNMIQVPSQPIAEGEPYLRSVVFDDAGIQYSKVTARVGSFNDIDHLIAVEAVTPLPNTEVSFRVATNTRELASGTATSSTQAPYIASFRETGKYLQSIEPGETLSVHFSDRGGRAYELVSPVEFAEPVFTEAPPRSFVISPGNQTDGTKDTRETVQAGKWFSGDENEIKIGIPGSPLEFFAQADGSWGLVLTLLDWTFLKRKNGENVRDPNESLKHLEGFWTQKARENFCKQMRDAFEESDDLYDGMAKKNKSCACGKFSNTVDGKLELSIVGMGSSREDEEANKKYLYGEFGIQGKVEIDVCFWQQYVIGYIPIYWTVELSGMVRIRAMLLGMRTEWFFRNIEWGFNESGSGRPAVVVVFLVSAYASIGVGVKGILGIALRIGGYLQMTFTFTKVDGRKFPHCEGKLAAELSLHAQLLFISTNVTIYNIEPWQFLDNWQDSAKLSSAASVDAAVQSALRNVTPSGGFDWSHAHVITEDELANSVEYVGRTVPVEAPAPEESACTAAGAAAADAASGTAAGAFESASSATIEYEYVGKGVSAATLQEAGAVFADPYDEANPYNPVHGLKPTTQDVIAQDVYSNARPRVFYTTYSNGSLVEETTKGISITARLVTVQIDSTNVRTRVALQLWIDGTKDGDEKVVEFDVAGTESGIPANLRDDVDFDACFTHHAVGAETTSFVLAVTSLQRTDPTGKTPQEVFEADECGQFITLLCATFAHGRFDSVKMEVYDRVDLLASADPDPRSVFHPRFMPYLFDFYPERSSWILDDGMLPVVYYRKSRVTGASSLGMCVYHLDPIRDGSTVCFCFDADVPIDDSVVGSDLFLHGDFWLSKGDGGKIGTDVSEDAYPLLFGWSGQKEEADSAIAYGFVESFRLSLTFNEDFSKRSFRFDRRDHLALPNVSNLTRRAHGVTAEAFAYTSDAGDAQDKELMIVAYDHDAVTCSVQSARERTCSTRFFPSPDGNYLYAVRFAESDVPPLNKTARAALDEDDGAVLYSDCYCDGEGTETIGAPHSSTGGEVKRYQLLEARWMASVGAYHDFYPIAQLDFIPDNTDVIYANAESGGKRSFIMVHKHIEDEENGPGNDEYTADIYHVAAANVRGLHLVGVTTHEKFGLPGDKVGYLAFIANTGNTLVTSVTMEVTDENGNLISKDTYDNLAECVQLGTSQCRQLLDEEGNVIRDENGNPKSVNEADKWDLAGILWPGSEREYLFNFKIPQEGYSGYTKFNVRIVDADATTSSLAASSSVSAADSDSATSPLSVDGATLAARADLMGAELQGDADEMAGFLSAACEELFANAGNDAVESHIDPAAKSFISHVRVATGTEKDDVDNVDDFTAAHYRRYQDGASDATAKTGDHAGIAAVAGAAAAAVAAGAATIAAHAR